MNEVPLEKSNNVKRKAFLIRHPDATRTNSHGPLAFYHPEDLTNARLIENKKTAVLKKLEHAKEMLKHACIEIHEAFLASIELKEAYVEFGDQRIDAILAQAAIRNAEIALSQD
jgi:hypothetical protein